VKVTEIGLISDTHGLVRPEALAALAGVERIVHAGDVGRPEVLELLTSIAPVLAVRGNVDRGAWAERLPPSAELAVGPVVIHVRHILEELDLEPAAAGFGVVVIGHSHQPTIERRGGVLFVNPGSAGPRRFKLPVTVARLTIVGEEVTARRLDLAEPER
jgi:putative phosphoesterase